MKNFKELKVWQKGIELVAIVYKSTPSFPEEEKYGLSAQMRRAAVSIPSNIAEGHLRKTAKGFKQFFRKEISCSTYNEKTEATMPVVAIDEEKKKLKIGHLTLYAKLLMDKASIIRQKQSKR